MSSIYHRSSTRRRRKPAKPYHNTPSTTTEERLLQQAIAKSKLDQRRAGGLSVPVGPTFYPTVEEFQGNPLHYINKIRPVAEKYGICKIVPPSGWNPPLCVDMNSKLKFQTKEQLIHRLQEGISFGDGEEYDPEGYQKMASEMAMKWRRTYYPHHDDVKVKDGEETSDEFESKRMTPENLERDYWETVETHNRNVTVEYGNDIDTAEYWSGFPLSERGHSINGTVIKEKVDLPNPEFGTEDYYKETWWNLNNIPCCPGSILRHVKVGINGINVPWLYFGSLFSTFCWHNEDNYLYSINYHHKGAPKMWYGVPGTRKDAEGLERVFKNYLSMKMRDVPDLMHHITTMFSPRLLQQGGVPVYKILQHTGEFVITFPRSFHGGFSLGPNVGEAVNFATHNWISHGADANERYRSFSRPAVFSHDRLAFTMANHLEEQMSNVTCELLGKELERIVEEELRLRERLIESGVRDVSADIELPKNRLDHIDEDSADYDDKRLCHSCKHVCFFSAVACECSQSKVSCLRHSHYMCQCSTERKYLLIWSTEQEMKTTLENTRRYCDMLKKKESSKDMESSSEDAEPSKDGYPMHVPDDIRLSQFQLLTKAPGAFRDWQAHKNDEIDLIPVRPVDSRPLFKSRVYCGALDSRPNHVPSLSINPTPKKIKLITPDSSKRANDVTISSSSGIETNGVNTIEIKKQ